MDNKHGDAEMIDPEGKKTINLPMEQPKRGRGRPSTGKALTPAEKQKAYRERLKSNVTGKKDNDGQLRFVRKLLDQEKETTERLANKVIELERQVDELKKGNVTVGQGITDEGVWTMEFMLKGAGSRTWRRSKGGCIGFFGVPDKFEMVKGHVNDMMNNSQTEAWRAVREDGLIYQPKAPRLKRKQPAKS